MAKKIWCTILTKNNILKQKALPPIRVVFWKQAVFLKPERFFPFGDAKIKFDVKYFNYAILFLIFDIETIFLYPFAVSLNYLGWFAVIEAFLFVAILLLGLYFAIKKRLLRWV